MLSRMKDWYYSRRADKLLTQGEFAEGLSVLRKVASIKEKYCTLALALMGYALTEILDTKEIGITSDREEYEQWKALSGTGRYKRMFYLDQETDIIGEGIGEIIEQCFSPGHPARQYYEQLRRQLDIHSS